MNSLQTMNADLSKVLSMARAQTSQFSRTKLPQLVAEYKEVIKAIHNDPNINEGAILAASFPAETTMGQIIHMPPGAKLLTKLHRDKKGGGNDDANFARCSQGIYRCCRQSWTPQVVSENLTIGIGMRCGQHFPHQRCRPDA